MSDPIPKAPGFAGDTYTHIHEREKLGIDRDVDASERGISCERPWTTFDQTDASGNPDINTLNALLRAGTNVRVFDVASVVSQIATGHSGPPQYLWKPNTPAFTVDGIHESQTGCYAIHDSGVINPHLLGS